MDHTKYVIFSGEVVKLSNPEGHNQYTGGSTAKERYGAPSPNIQKGLDAKASAATRDAVKASSQAIRSGMWQDHAKAATAHEAAVAARDKAGLAAWNAGDEETASKHAAKAVQHEAKAAEHSKQAVPDKV